MSSALLFSGAALLAVLLSLVTYVQMLYMESMRLRTRDLPALEWFKQKLEKKLGLRPDAGLLSFSLVKYILIVAIAALAVDGFTAGRSISWVALSEAVIAAWFIMLLAACVVPALLYR